VGLTVDDLFLRIAKRRVRHVCDPSAGRVVCYQRLLTDGERMLLASPASLLTAIVRVDLDADKQIPWYDLGDLALRVITLVLAQGPVGWGIPPTEASGLARAFLEAAGAGARFFSNMKHAFGERGSSACGMPLLDPLETGVIALNAERVTILWVLDED
jgi:hypothetical protein